MLTTQQILARARSGPKIRFNKRAAARNVRRKMIQAGKTPRYIQNNLKQQVNKYRKKTQTKVAQHQAKVAKHNAQQSKLAAAAAAGKKALAGRLAYGAFTRMTAPLGNLARIGRWQ